jgi:hypothetical protein
VGDGRGETKDTCREGGVNGDKWFASNGRIVGNGTGIVYVGGVALGVVEMAR